MVPTFPPPSFPAPELVVSSADLSAPPEVAPSVEGSQCSGRAPLCSRSTSSGSLTTINTDEDAVSASSGALRGSPRSWDDEAVVAIKNTFINLALSRQPSLDGFFEERMLRSCPATRCPSPERSDSDCELQRGQESPQHQQQQQQQRQRQY
mmetsp:Transcript_134214/g.261402  ORF Transcript_134214/g.261402 Transcript_134214/m.261402 type:complete len:151 (+) Transcript_134214:71-523(+)